MTEEPPEPAGSATAAGIDPAPARLQVPPWVQLVGIGGILLALPLLAVGREIVQFVRERISLGRWPEPIPDAVLATSGGMLGGATVADAAASAAAPARRPFVARLQARLPRRPVRRRDSDGGSGGSDPSA